MVKLEELEPATAKHGEKLQLIKSPIIEPGKDADGNDLDIRQLKRVSTFAAVDLPKFQTRHDANLLELFFDLFFAANFSVFANTQSITSHERFTAYIGYFSILWVSWMLVAMYDVRYLSDSVFEPIARGVHLGVMVGFAVVAPNFYPSDQDVRTMRTMSLILMVSRLCLAVEYFSNLYHARKYKAAILPLSLQTSSCLMVCPLYLGIVFRFKESEGNSRVFLIWYFIAAVELVSTILLSKFFSVLSFKDTHLMRRMSLLTVIILGDGILMVGENVVTIVQSPDTWNALVIGIVAAATVTIYCVFLVYFDWMKEYHLSPWRQLLWTLLHYPFHLAMVIFVQGFTQFIIWSKVINILDNLTIDSVLNTAEDIAKTNSQEVKANLTQITNSFFEEFPVKHRATWDTVNAGLNNISEIPDTFWEPLSRYVVTLKQEDMPPKELLVKFYAAFSNIMYSMQNSLFETYGIDLFGEIQDGGELPLDPAVGGTQSSINVETWKRYGLVFSYGYISCGATLLFMTILTIVARRKPWRPWVVIRTGIYILLSIGVGLISVLYYFPIHLQNYLFSPWLNPTICLVWVLVLVLTHTRRAPAPIARRVEDIFTRKSKNQSHLPDTSSTELESQPLRRPHRVKLGETRRARFDGDDHVYDARGRSSTDETLGADSNRATQQQMRQEEARRPSNDHDLTQRTWYRDST